LLALIHSAQAKAGWLRSSLAAGYGACPCRCRQLILPLIPADFALGTPSARASRTEKNNLATLSDDQQPRYDQQVFDTV
jgi:hypothetical protein